METVIVPAHQRGDFLRACLTRLLAADNDRLKYLISMDRGYSSEVSQVATWFLRKVGTRRATVAVRQHRYRGNSYNVLTSYREALVGVMRLRHFAEPELVHLVEEDILVGRDYFDFHRRAHELVPDAFSVSACRNQYYPVGTGPEPDDTAVYRHGSYQSIGVSFRPGPLRRGLAHAVPSFFRDQVGYCAANFPHTKINRSHAEQDGLLHRVLEQEGASTVYAAVPRAYHVGFVGYHRNGERPQGSLEERAEAILAMSAEELNRRAHSYPDHTTVPLDGHREPVSKIITWP
jgi:hypothetical protein